MLQAHTTRTTGLVLNRANTPRGADLAFPVFNCGAIFAAMQFFRNQLKRI